MLFLGLGFPDTTTSIACVVAVPRRERILTLDKPVERVRGVFAGELSCLSEGEGGLTGLGSKVCF